MSSAEARPKTRGPDISLIMPCFNEEQVVGYTVPKLSAAFRQAGQRLELIAVDNGSSDRTGEIIRELAAKDPSVVPHRVEINEGYGNGILNSVSRCGSPWVGIISADGQVDAEDVVRLYESALATDGKVLAKVRRRFRMDGLLRKIISTCYNLFVRLLWPRLGSIDVNGTPKLIRWEYLLAMDLSRRGGSSTLKSWSKRTTWDYESWSSTYLLG